MSTQVFKISLTALFTFFSVLLFAYGNTHIRVIATADLHAMVFPYDFIADKPYPGGLARVKSFVDAERKLPGQHVILLDNGDLLQGQPVGYYYSFVAHQEPHLISRMMNQMQFDAASVGNHDVETGPEVYNRIIHEFEFPWLAANAVDALSGQPYFQPYTIIERQGIRIAVLGLITPSVPNWLPEKLWDGLEFADMYATAKYWMNHIRENEQADAVIGLFHSGAGDHIAYADYPQLAENAARFVATHVPGFDAVLTAHDHIERNEVITNSAGNEVILIGGKSYGRSVAVVDFSFSGSITERVQLESVQSQLVETSDYEPCPDFEAAFQEDFDRVHAYVREPVGRLNNQMRSRDAYFGNAAFTDFVHELQLELSGAAISIAAPLSYDVLIPEGELQMRDMFKLYQFENYLYVMELSGAELHGFLEFSYGLWLNTLSGPDDHLLRLRTDEDGHTLLNEEGKARLRHPFYNFDSSVGLSYTVDVREAAGERVHISALADGSPFHMDSLYRVAMNSYRASGGGYHITRGAGIPHSELKSRILSVSEKDLRSHIADYIREKGKVSPKANNNWKIIPEEWARPAGKRDYLLLFGED